MIPKIGQEVALTAPITFSKALTKAPGVVRRTVRAGKVCQVGVEFKPLEPDQHQELVSYVEAALEVIRLKGAI